MAYGPMFAYEPPPFYAIRAGFIGGGGGLEFVENRDMQTMNSVSSASQIQQRFGSQCAIHGLHPLDKHLKLTCMGSQHPSPNVKTLCNFEAQISPEIITSRDAESTCFEGSRTSCDVISSGICWPNFGRKRSHHMMDASC